eukprot:SAG25_NODE_12128_length_287_cov_0.803191_2_plen_60_part_01
MVVIRVLATNFQRLSSAYLAVRIDYRCRAIAGSSSIDISTDFALRTSGQNKVQRAPFRGL